MVTSRGWVSAECCSGKGQGSKSWVVRLIYWGRFLFNDQRRISPLSPPVRKCCSSTTATQSTLPWGKIVPVLLLPSEGAPSLWTWVWLDLVSALLWFVGSWNTNCVSSTIFHTRAERSRLPTLTHRSELNDATFGILSWWPNRVSMYAKSFNDQSFRVRSELVEYNWFVDPLQARL